MPAKTLPGGTFIVGQDLTVTRMGYGAMQLAGAQVSAHRPTATLPWRCCARWWTWASPTLTPATTTARTSPTSGADPLSRTPRG